MLEIKNAITETENAFDGLMSWLDMAEERISEIEDLSVVTLKTEKQREQRPKNAKQYPRSLGQLKKM